MVHEDHKTKLYDFPQEEFLETICPTDLNANHTFSTLGRTQGFSTYPLIPQKGKV